MEDEMAVISVVMGSVLGFFAAVFCWLALDFSVLESLTLYLLASLGCGALGAATAILRRSESYSHELSSEA
ncbi:hypothetical protein [Tropicibacter alexandrii]|uniref:hypothetical protein n=1 Tax=Tropicibacter alexandrii TaxID=2267683 RepID=UPI0010092826|nr:hypothetical protein [Tropicibacter alexandrii]